MRRRGAEWVLLLGLLLPLSGTLHAQTAAPDIKPSAGMPLPSLQKRSARNPDADTALKPVAATGHTDMSPESEGRYPWDKRGGEIELYFEGGQLDGYMTEHVDPDQHVAAVTYHFATTHVDGHALAFTTQAIHGVSYSFSGHLERGVAPSPMLPGYYLLTGTLVTHGGDSGDFKQVVSLKRKPGQ